MRRGTDWPCRKRVVVLTTVSLVLCLAAVLSSGVALGGSASGPAVIPEMAVEVGAVEDRVGAACSVGERFPEPGESVRIDASASTDADQYRYDFDGDGEYDTGWVNASSRTASFDDGNYTPRVAVRNSTPEDPIVDITTCPTVEVAPNEPPRPRVTYSPRPAIARESVTLDASNSTDVDGNVTEYRWDFDGDGGPDNTTTVPRITTTYTYGETFAGGFVNVGVVVVDDDGATGTRTLDLRVRPNPLVRCSVEPRAIPPGGNVTVDVSASEHADLYRYDFDGDGEYDTDLLSTTPVDSGEYERNFYSEAGTYTPRVLAVNTSADPETRTVGECPNVTVEADNEPPRAVFTVSPNPSVAGGTTTLNASQSSDPDGRVRYYRWDFDGDGTVDRNATAPVLTMSFDYNTTLPGLATVALTVVDDDGATDLATTDLELVREEGTTECAVSPRSVAPGETVTVSVDPASTAERWRYDKDSTGEFGPPTTDTTRSVTYDSPGNYTPRVAVRNEVTNDTRVIECDPVTVRADNDPPEASFTVSPRPAVAGERTTLDATASVDPDGRIRYYRWDFDGDGTVDRNTTRATVSTRFPYDASAPGLANVALVVVDDDGARARAGSDLNIVRPDLTAVCTVSHRTVRPGESVTLRVDTGPRTDRLRYDEDSSGAFTPPTTERTATVTYEDPGTYTPRVSVENESADQSAVVECPPVTVDARNLPPDAVLTHRPALPDPGRSVTVDASGSTDPDGTVVAYRWDLDGDGTTDRVTGDPVVSFGLNGSENRSVTVIAVDDDNATAAASTTVPVRSTAACTLPFGLPCWTALPGLLFGGVGGGMLLCRRLGGRRPRRGDDDGDVGGIDAYASGTVARPADSDRQSVTGLGFEPDVLLFTAPSAVDHADGWSYGKALREPDGKFTQNVVTVADDKRRTDAGICAVREGRVLELVDPDDGNGTLVGRLGATRTDGFELEFEGGRPVEPGEEPTIMFQALSLSAGTDAAIGHVPVPDGGGSPVDGSDDGGETAPSKREVVETQTLNVGFDPAHVVFTATNAPGTGPAEENGDVVGVSHGDAVDHGGTVRQRVVNSSVDPGALYRNSYAATESDAVHLLYGDGPDERTTARVTDLDGRVKLAYDRAFDGPGLVTFLAIGGQTAPAIGHVGVPGPDDDGRVTVEVGFEPSMIELTACNVDVVGGERTVEDSPFSFGWSHGTATPGAGGIDHHMLHGAFDAADPFAGGTPAAADGGRSGGGDGAPGGSHTARTGNRVPDGPNGSSPNAATVFSVDEDGRILGRDDVRVGTVTGTGFELSVADVSTVRRSSATGRRPVVFYRAWPAPEGPR